ncbi:MAG: hypothetical protein Kow0067_00960 [Coriobacteriia bacterium]
MAVHACDHIGYCPLTADATGYSPEFARNLRTIWCRGEFTACARYHAARLLGTENVPVDLFPVDRERVSQLLAN